MPRGLADKTVALMTEARSILVDLHPHTVRGVCYQLFTRKLIKDMSKNETARVSRVLTTAREAGVIPWSWIVDDTRPVEQAPSWDDPADFVESVKDQYRKDRWTNQPERVIVVSEKGTVGGILRPVLREYGVPFAVYHGFGSATAVWKLARRSVGDRRPLTILYVGDHDPSGRYMSDVDLPSRLEEYGGEADILRAAVTDLDRRYRRLPTFPADDKTKDARHACFVRTHGHTCCELDAMDPNDLRDVVEEQIRDLMDLDAWERAGSTEEAEITSLNDVLKDVVGHLRRSA